MCTQGNSMTEYLETKVDKFTFRVATDRFYNNQGVWALKNGSTVRVGLSDYVQQRSGDIAFVDVKTEGSALSAGDEVAAIETIKVNTSITNPVAGVIVKNNPLMETAPETINLDPYGEGWLCEIEVSDWEMSQAALLNPSAYFAQVKQEAEEEAKKS
jgi:glycine cleavage system H protein